MNAKLAPQVIAGLSNNQRANEYGCYHQSSPTIAFA